MAEPFLAEIKILAFNFAPRGWALCDGQILPIDQNQSLYSLLGTTYGGDGRTSFALPDLRGRTPIHFGDTPTQCVGCLLHIGDDRCQQVRDTFVDIEFQHLRIDKDKAYFIRFALI